MSVQRSLLNPRAPAFHPPSLRPMPYHFFAPSPLPLLPSPPVLPSSAPFTTVDSAPRKNVRRPSVTRVPRNIPPRLIAALENTIPQVPPRLRNSYVAKQGGAGFSRASNEIGSSNEGLVCRRVENDQRRSLCYVKRGENSTTVMIKNIPYDYNREMLMQFLDRHCSLENQKATDSKGEHIVSAYDLLYLPMDFKNKSSKGYAFVNFTDHRTVWNFFCAYNDKLNVFPGYTRRVKIVNAKIQGKEALVNRFKDTWFECESGFLPVMFSPPRDGSQELVQIITLGKCKATPSSSYIHDE